MLLVRKARRLIIVLLICLVALFYWSGNTQALMVEISFEELTEKADSIVTGTVQSTTSYWNEDRTNIFTEVTIVVEDALKGPDSSAFTVIVEGGTVGKITQWVSHTPGFLPGEQVGLFLKELEPSDLEKMKITEKVKDVRDVSPVKVYGSEQGKISFGWDTEVKMFSEESLKEEFRENVTRVLEGKPVLQTKQATEVFSTTEEPVITSITPHTASAGTGAKIIVQGSGFGSGTGPGDYLRFYVRENISIITFAEDTVSWEEREIIAKVPIRTIFGYPYSASSGPVTVTNNFIDNSNEWPFAVTFGFDGRMWPGENPEVKFLVNPDIEDEIAQARINAIKAAAESWNEANANFSFKYKGVTGATETGNNGFNEVLWESGLPSNVLGRASIWSEDYVITETDFAFNPSFTWTTSDDNVVWDVESVAVHEFGHWLMLRDLYGDDDTYELPDDWTVHPIDRHKVMFGFGYEGELKRDLDEDDIAGIRWIYGPDTAPPTGSITINDEEAYTNDENVNLSLFATDNVAVAAYRLANGTDASGGTVVTITPATLFFENISWELPAGDGVKVVAVQYRDEAENWSENYTASIILDQTSPTLQWHDSDPAPNAAGWNNTAVEITYTPADNLSGVASAEPASPLVFNDEDAGQTIEVIVTDNAGNSANFTSAEVNIDWAPPEITSVSVSPDLVSKDTPVEFSLMATDALSGIASYYYSIDGGDWVAMKTDGTATYTPPAAAVHEVQFRVTDIAGNEALSEKVLLVVYDPEAGFVTGSGWIWSPEGAFAANPELEGRATFGFVSRYQRGQSIPDGNTQFQFRTADLNFHSTEYEWLVIAGHRAQFKGSGTINGAGDYGFLLTAIDGNLTPSQGYDSFRIKIWDKTTDAIVYDNQMGESDTGDDFTELGGGSIIIHSGGGGRGR